MCLLSDLQGLSHLYLTETKNRMDGLMIPNGRIAFWGPNSNGNTALQGHSVMYFGPNLMKFRKAFGGMGQVLKLVTKERRELKAELSKEIEISYSLGNTT